MPPWVAALERKLRLGLDRSRAELKRGAKQQQVLSEMQACVLAHLHAQETTHFMQISQELAMVKERIVELEKGATLTTVESNAPVQCTADVALVEERLVALERRVASTTELVDCIQSATDLAPVEERVAALESRIASTADLVKCTEDLALVEERLAALDAGVAPATCTADMTLVEERLAALESRATSTTANCNGPVQCTAILDLVEERLGALENRGTSATVERDPPTAAERNPPECSERWSRWRHGADRQRDGKGVTCLDSQIPQDSQTSDDHHLQQDLQHHRTSWSAENMLGQAVQADVHQYQQDMEHIPFRAVARIQLSDAVQTADGHDSQRILQHSPCSTPEETKQILSKMSKEQMQILLGTNVQQTAHQQLQRSNTAPSSPQLGIRDPLLTFDRTLMELPGKKVRLTFRPRTQHGHTSMEAAPPTLGDLASVREPLPYPQRLRHWESAAGCRNSSRCGSVSVPLPASDPRAIFFTERAESQATRLRGEDSPCASEQTVLITRTPLASARG